MAAKSLRWHTPANRSRNGMMTTIVDARTPVLAGSRPQSLQAAPISAKLTTDSRCDRVPVGGRITWIEAPRARAEVGHQGLAQSPKG